MQPLHLQRNSVPRLVCFDVGGVLVRISRTWDEAVENAGLDQRVPKGEKAESLLRERRRIMDAHQVGALEANRYYREMSAAFADLYSAAEMERIHAAWLLEEYDGVGELIRELDRGGRVTTACLSNTNDAHWKRLNQGEEFPAVQQLKHRLASHEMGLAKPQPDIYRAAAAKFDVPVESILFFDDLPPNVTAAREAGWRAELTDPHGDPARHMRGILSHWGLL